ncbi:hypothetical protein GGR56DRAFT_39356 [Xylariaceae sp. FL0804]|nr:hypothetical protein GGR56DRAFT_39356 [Xylariaceae sp. FL0804]
MNPENQERASGWRVLAYRASLFLFSPSAPADQVTPIRGKKTKKKGKTRKEQEMREENPDTPRPARKPHQIPTKPWLTADFVFFAQPSFCLSRDPITPHACDRSIRSVDAKTTNDERARPEPNSRATPAHSGNTKDIEVGGEKKSSTPVVDDGEMRWPCGSDNSPHATWQSFTTPGSWQSASTGERAWFRHLRGGGQRLFSLPQRHRPGQWLVPSRRNSPVDASSPAAARDHGTTHTAAANVKSRLTLPGCFLLLLPVLGDCDPGDALERGGQSWGPVEPTLWAQALHVCSLQYRHSKIHQCGPEWQTLQVHWTRVLSDLIILNECAQLLATAMVNGWALSLSATRCEKKTETYSPAAPVLDHMSVEGPVSRREVGTGSRRLHSPSNFRRAGRGWLLERCRCRPTVGWR